MYKKYFEGKKGVAFDLDGTIIDSIPYWKASFQKVLDDLNQYVEKPESLPIDRGSYVSKIWKYIKKAPGIEIDLSIKELTNKTQEVYMQLFDSDPLEPREGFWELVAELKEKKFKLALASNSHAKVLDHITTQIGIKDGIFDVIVAGDQVRKKKPHPKIYKVVIRKLKLRPKEILCFEDSVSGAKAAKGANLETIAIWNGQVIETDYPRNVKDFVPDFSSFPGNLDTTYIEEVKKSLDLKGI